MAQHKKEHAVLNQIPELGQLKEIPVPADYPGDSANLQTATLSLYETNLIGLITDTSYSLLH